MNKFFTAVFMAVMVSGLCYSQDYKPTTEYGFTIVKPITNSYVWTNDNAYAYKISSMIFNSTVANTTTVTRIHKYEVNQEVGDVVTTNYWDTVETNYNYQVTNVLTTTLTNTLLSVTNAGSTIYGTSDIKQVYILFGDILTWACSDNNTKILIFDAIR